MNKLLREVPTIESWISDASSEFVQVSLHQDFIKLALEKLRASVNTWLLEPQEFCDAIVKRCKFINALDNCLSYQNADPATAMSSHFTYMPRCVIWLPVDTVALF